MTTGDVNSGTILRNLAKDLLTPDENDELKSALQIYRSTGSITGLVAQLTKVVTSTEKLMILVELSSFLSEPLRRDFHKLCCLHFPKFDSFLKYFTPNTVGERNWTISKDSTGQFQVISTGLDANFFAPTDERSLQGESGIDVNSDVDDISRHGGDTNNSFLGNSWKIESRFHRGSVSSHADQSAQSVPTPKGSISSTKQLQQQPWKQSHCSLPIDQGGGNIRNRARSLRVLSGSMPSVLAHYGGSTTPGRDNRVRILLKRRQDGSLGLGVRGGKEYKCPIEVVQVEAGSQGEVQGLRVGDRILDVNGTDFTNITHAEAVMIMRNAWNIIMVVQHKRSDEDWYRDVANAGVMSVASLDDWQVTIYPTKKGKLGCGVYRDKYNLVVVKKVDKNSPASKAGLSKGDHFLEIEDIPVSSLTDKQIATLTHSKRIRIKVMRPSGSVSTRAPSAVSTRAPSEHIEFNNMFSPLALDLSKLDGNDTNNNSQHQRDDDEMTFASSTPRKPEGRSHSEERHVVRAEVRADVHERSRSASQNRESSKTKHKNKSSKVKRPLPPTPLPLHDSDDEFEFISKPKQDNNSNSSRSNSATRKSNEMPSNPSNLQDNSSISISNNSINSIKSSNFTLSSEANTNKSKQQQQQKLLQHQQQLQQKQLLQQQQQHQQMLQQQQRLYRPRVMVPNRQSSNSYSPSMQHRQHMINHHSTSKHLGRYISHNNNFQQSLPSRMAMIYSPKPKNDHNFVEHDRSRPKKRTMSTSASSKMKEIRNRSHSPHYVITHQSTNQNNRRPGSMPPHRDREFLKAIQSSVERRQRAHRLSLYQLPDQDDDTWRID